MYLLKNKKINLKKNDVKKDSDVKFDAYVTSKTGIDSENNSDSYYINGVFAEDFKMGDIEKTVHFQGQKAIFAVSTGMNSARASKLAIGYLAQKHEWIVSSKSVSQVKEKLRIFIKECNNYLVDMGKSDGVKYEASIIIAVYFNEYIIYSTCGSGALVLKSKTRIKSLTTRGINLGEANLADVKIKTLEYSSDDRLILCSRGILKADKLPVETSFFEDDSPYGLASKLTDEAIKSIICDATCLAVQARIREYIHIKTLAVVALSLLWILINIIIITFFI